MLNSDPLMGFCDLAAWQTASFSPRVHNVVLTSDSLDRAPTAAAPPHVNLEANVDMKFRHLRVLGGFCSATERMPFSSYIRLRITDVGITIPTALQYPLYSAFINVLQV